MSDGLELRRESLIRVLDVVRGLGTGAGLDDTLRKIADAVVDVLGFDAVVINVRSVNVRSANAGSGDDALVARTVVGPPEVGELVGESTPHATWLALLARCHRWGELRFHEDFASLDEFHSVAYVDPSPEHAHRVEASGIPQSQVWQPEFALLAPMWSAPNELLGVISVDLPVRGTIPDAEQQAILELFAGQAGAAISEANRLETAEDEQVVYRTVFLESPSATAVLDEDCHVMEANGSFADLVGRPGDSWLGLHVSALFDGCTPGDDTADHPVLRPDEKPYWARLRWRRVVGASGTRFICTAEDRTDTRHDLDDLRRRAEQDDLTGLAVRSVALDDLQNRLDDAASGRGSGVVGFLYFDVDSFKPINDRYGHPVGDRVLTEMARRLRGCAGSGDLVCRMGGDEFAIVTSRDSSDSVAALGHLCLDAATMQYGSLDTGVPVDAVGMSIGVGTVEDRQTASQVVAGDVVSASDEALYRAKRDSTSRIHFVRILPARVIPAG